MLAGVLALGTLLAGCGQRTDGGTAAGAGGDRDELSGQVTVLAAASLTESFTELAKRFEAEHPGVRVRTSFGASSALVQQVAQGAPADVIATADTTTMDTIANKDLTAGTPRVFVRNELQIAVPRGNPGHVRDLADFATPDLALGVCAEQVPCGRAARKAFDEGGVDARPDTYGQDVKAVLTKVQHGELDAGIVYASDVHAAGDSVEGIAFPEAKAALNDYPIAALKDAPNAKAAKAYAAYVGSDAAADVLTEAGFRTP